MFAEAETFTVAEFEAEPEAGDTVNQDWFEVAVQALFADTVNDEDEADEVREMFSLFTSRVATSLN